MIGQEITILSSDWLSRQLQLNTTFHHELKDPLSQMVFRNVFRSAPCISVSTLSTIILIYCSVSARSLGWTCRAWRARPWRGTSARWTCSPRGDLRRGGAACTRYCTVLYCTVLYYTPLYCAPGPGQGEPQLLPRLHVGRHLLSQRERELHGGAAALD